jgi:uncharacterized protein YxeA
LETPVIIAGTIFTVCIIVIFVYFIDFIKFVRKNNDSEKEYIQNLNETIQKMLSHRKKDISATVMNIDDYQEVKKKPPINYKKTKKKRSNDYSDLKPNNPNTTSDVYIEEMLSRHLLYMEHLKMWINTKKD